MNEDLALLLASRSYSACDRVALLNRGQIVAEGHPQELKEKFGSANLEEVFAKVVGLA